jgi:hypothetical protein
VVEFEPSGTVSGASLEDLREKAQVIGTGAIIICQPVQNQASRIATFEQNASRGHKV